MSIEEKIENVKGSFAMEGIRMTENDETNAKEIISKERNVDEIVAGLKNKYRLMVEAL